MMPAPKTDDRRIALDTARELLADVNPTFNWVRLAQRVPVRIRIDALPAGMTLTAGSTGTVVVKGHDG